MKYSIEFKERLRSMKSDGYSYGELSILFNIPKPSLQYIIEQKRKDNKKKRGRSSIITPRIKNRIKHKFGRLQTKKEIITANKIISNLELELSKRTMQRALRCLGAKYRNIPKVCPINNKAKETRMKTASDWVRERVNFKKVIFSDECRFSLDGPDKMYSWQMDCYPEIMRDKLPMGGGGVMVWGCIMPDGLIFLNRLPNNITGEVYAEFLENTVFPLLKARYGNDFIWQQDNAPPHTARISQDIIAEGGVEILSWPPYSPDLNPIENLWGYMKTKVYNVCLPNSLDALWEKIQEVVEEINIKNKDFIKTLYNGMNDRVIDVIANKGDRIRK